MDGIDGRGRRPGSLARVLSAIAAERAAQDAIWGYQEFPDGTGAEHEERAAEAKRACAEAWSRGELTWRHILAEEFFESLAESDPAKLRTELIQTAAVAAKWVQSLDRRNGALPPAGGSGGRPEKLVRDRVPDLIELGGGQAETRVAADDEFGAFLRAKLYEEAGEYVASADPVELADVLEVLLALAGTHGIDPAGLERMRTAKAAERGAFARRIVLRRPPPEAETSTRVRHAVRAILFDGDELVLFRRTKPGRAPYWTTPGGRIETHDAGPEAALRRELDEELGATAGPLRQVFAHAEDLPGTRYLSVFYVCRLQSMDLSLRHGPEFSNPAKGRYDVERVPCDPAAIDSIDLVPTALSSYLQAHAADLPSLLPA